MSRAKKTSAKKIETDRESIERLLVSHAFMALYTYGKEHIVTKTIDEICRQVRARNDRPGFGRGDV